jgi:hypothetical protein
MAAEQEPKATPFQQSFLVYVFIFFLSTMVPGGPTAILVGVQVCCAVRAFGSANKWSELRTTILSTILLSGTLAIFYTGMPNELSLSLAGLSMLIFCHGIWISYVYWHNERNTTGADR